MRCAHAIALLLTGSSAVLSAVLPPGHHRHSFWYEVADVATSCPKPVLKHIRHIVAAAHQKNNTAGPLDVLNNISTFCHMLFGPDRTPHHGGSSNSSAQLSTLHARQLEDLDLGKRYGPQDPDFLAAAAGALFSEHWTFDYDHQAFWTAQVARALISKKYDRIFTMPQAKKVRQKEKTEIAEKKAAEKEKKQQAKDAKKAAKQAEKEMLKKMSDEERKKYKEDKKEAEKTAKAEAKRLKTEQKANERAAKKERHRLHKIEKENDEKAYLASEKFLTNSKHEFFAQGGGPAIGEEDLFF